MARNSRSTRLSPRLLALSAACVALLGAAGTADAATGARVLVQAWNPVTPDNPNVQTLVDQPTLVSDSLQDAWTRVRPALCREISGQLGVGGLAHGQTLYDITCILDERPEFEVAAMQGNALSVKLGMGFYLEATSTVPDPFGSYADPRVSIAAKAHLQLTLQVQADRNHTLRVAKALFSISDATLDSHNAIGDIAKYIASDLSDFFLGIDFKTVAENAINSQSIDLAQQFDGTLGPVNDVLSGPSDYVRVGVSGAQNYITVAFAPREFVPITTGSMRGVVRWDPNQFTPTNGCQSFDIRATVQTGPVPLLTPNAEAPMRPVGSFQATPAGDAACAFTLSGLAAGWPNILTPHVAGLPRGGTGSSLYRVSYGLMGDNWGGRVVVPQPVADNRNYLVARSIDATASDGRGPTSLKNVRDRNVDPVINPADIYTDRARAVSRDEVMRAAVSDVARDKASTVSLNPQPLPPGPDDHQATQTQQEQAVAAKTASPIAHKRRIVLPTTEPAVTPSSTPVASPVR